MASGNVRLNRSKERSARDMARSTPTSGSRSKAAPKASARAELDQRIKHLECYIVSASADAKRHHAMMADYIPADESFATKRSSRRRPMNSVHLERRRSAALFMQIIVLMIVIAAAIGLLNQRFNLWN